ncbi:hypothetical protein ACFQ2B_26830 [Streptomyces stramineus]
MSVRRAFVTVLARLMPCENPAGPAGTRQTTTDPLPPRRAGGAATEESQ